MERVEGDYAVLDSGAGVCAVCADDAEATMRKLGNILGCVGLAAFGISFFLSQRLSNIFGILAICLFVVAGILESRKWFIAVGVILLIIGIMYLLLLHRD